MKDQGNNRLSRWFGERKAVRMLLLAAILLLAVIHFDAVLEVAVFLVNAARPLLIGAAIAYVLEIVIRPLETNLFPYTNRDWLDRIRRPLAILLAAAMLISLLVLIVNIVIPGLTQAVTVLARELPGYFESVKAWALENFKDVDFVKNTLEPIEFDWGRVQERVLKLLSGAGTSGLLSSTMSVVGTVTGKIGDFLMAFIFAMFVLSGKGMLKGQFNRVVKVLLPEKKRSAFMHVMTTANRSFSGFIIGQTLYGLISGVSTWLFMMIFRMPYALMIGVLCGTMMLIPVIGGYLGAAFGTFLVFTANPGMAVWFLIFIVALQTLEGNTVYPRLLGSNMGMPGMWVLAAVTLGGGLGGIVGMLLAVPVLATAYALLREYVGRREAEEAAASGEKEPETGEAAAKKEK